MKKIIIVFILLGFGGIAYASDVPFWSHDNVEVYKFTDKDYDTNCYVAVSTRLTNTPPSISCVK